MMKPTEDEAQFEPEETPTNPSAPAPEELARQTWLASETRAIGPLRSQTSRFRAMAVVAMEGGAARMSHVDVLEANAKSQPAKCEVQQVPVPEAPSASPVRRPLGPRGTVRMVATIFNRGPTGTLKMRGWPPPRREVDDAAKQHRVRVGWFIAAVFVLLCIVGVDAQRAETGSAPHASAAAMAAPQPAQAEEGSVQVVPSLDPDPPSATAPAAPQPQRAGASPAKRAHKRPAAPGSVF